MKTLLTTTAFVALLATAPAFAQSDTQPAQDQAPAATQAQPQTDQAPAAPDANAPAMAPQTDQGTAAPADQNMAPDTAQAPADQKTTVAAAPDKVFVDRQGDEDRLASNWIGQTVYNQNNESIGDINDLLLDKDGKISAVILGVGGFLGIGEKSIAIAFSAVQATSDENGKLKLVANVSKEALDSAPEFMTVADIKAQQAQPAPAEPAAPAPAQ